MKSALTIIPLIALILVGIAGPLTMVHGAEHGATCPVATIANLPCLMVGTIADHIAALQGLLVAVPSSLVLAFLAVFAFFALWSAIPVFVLVCSVRPKIRYPSGDIPRSYRTFLRWQAQFVHSPTIA